MPESRMEELTKAEEDHPQATDAPDDDEFAARDEAEQVAMEEALHYWDTRLVTLFRIDARSNIGPRRRMPGASSALGSYGKEPFEWWDRPRKRDRSKELNIILLDDRRLNPVFNIVLGMNTPETAAQSMTLRTPILLEKTRRNPVVDMVLESDALEKPHETVTRRADAGSSLPTRWIRGSRPCRHHSWEQFKAELRRLLELMGKEPDRFVVVASHDPKRFVQFATGEGNTLIGEAVSNEFLEPHEQLDRKTRERLGPLGWKHPTKKRPNFWQTWPTSAGTSKPASVAVRTLKDVFGIESPASMEIQCERFA